jgi:hypothetical protein
MEFQLAQNATGLVSIQIFNWLVLPQVSKVESQMRWLAHQKKCVILMRNKVWIYNKHSLQKVERTLCSISSGGSHERASTNLRVSSKNASPKGFPDFSYLTWSIMALEIWFIRTFRALSTIWQNFLVRDWLSKRVKKS